MFAAGKEPAVPIFYDGEGAEAVVLNLKDPPKVIKRL
jgi:hypothetical protein